jgi:hypothetical protein
MTNESPLIKVCPVYENVSKDGSTYYAAYLGGAKLLVLRNKRAAEGEAPWTLFVCARPERKPQQEAPPEPEAKPAAKYPQHRSAEPRPRVHPEFDDEIPF